MPSLQHTTDQFTAFIRNPEQQPAPANIEARRLKIYRDLFYNNIEGFVSGAFPVLRSLIAEQPWHALVRDFMVTHRCQSPYFLEISQEFQHYLAGQPAILATGDYPVFIQALTHYEWVELALDVAEDDLAQFKREQGLAELKHEQHCDWLQQRPLASPLAWSLAYQYPVHLIGLDYQPQQASEQPSYLLVYRNLQDQVGFMEANAVTARLLELVNNNPQQLNGEQLLLQLAQEMQHPNPEQIISSGLTIYQQLYELDILLGTVAVS
ncbi:putative DNA-binding domain-containing protein [Dasania sp. GY-MA-18]|uniref:DNA-binding domain-containing protein n=1 Tax=Dasania phycosphaerae TaxID=2950436 RepID=A0A9J6RP72_9GAMM|nr:MULTISPECIES: putative DNA-binding domain-containing protein [Dasania]MCR8923550.1 putative DNA-binding domain-containing protein [Dasania sp. GY-MA-18]MCZ0865984.1 putative DNA-binding domain-containing protein [Dasania phycosphaerae]MCZ0869708.1 putative DNA-binding domain-containing protein [Dasania phycosphaerae]